MKLIDFGASVEILPPHSVLYGETQAVMLIASRSSPPKSARRLQFPKKQPRA